MTSTDARVVTVATVATAEAPDAAEAPDTAAVVDAYLATVADPAATPERIAAHYGERVDWMCADNPAVPWLRPRATRDDVAAHWRELREHTVAGAGGASVDALVISGPEAVLTGQLWGTVRATGKPFRSPFALRFTVEGGEIVRHHVYEDSLAIAAACAPGE
ncbi:nuclear transport factor 2 family protein [Streptomyces paromomycinus]|uniref:Ketosteroid isomerase n=1 Tax=Streptomyces paromomycinus TaxID=92743 RepID=A0A401W3I9_STREY|nr:nuclear transport factor 2 family protein [Streptomyces paromomycinus]GCD43874.1 ketosteroid isomerase [Streptomyces paromomycinus]